MTSILASRPALLGVMFAVAGSALMSVNDLVIKALSGSYALHQVILIRAGVGMVFLFTLIAVSGTGFAQLRTARPRGHLLRVGFVMLSNVLYFLGLAALPLPDAVAIGFVSQLFVTILSVVILREKVGRYRWAAVIVGFAGVIVMLRPGAGSVQTAALLVVLSALCYAASHMMTRHMRGTESAFALSFYVQTGFIFVCTTMGLLAGDGRFAGSSDPSLAFLFRPWVWPPMADWPAFAATGLAVAGGGLMISQAYRLSDAALIAPFEYSAMPFAIFWGIVAFGTFPDRTAWIGIALIVGAGLYTAWRETRVR